MNEYEYIELIHQSELMLLFFFFIVFLKFGLLILALLSIPSY